MGGSFVSRLRDKLSTGHAPVCIGLDPRLASLPDSLLPSASPVERIRAFHRELLPAIAPHAPAVKPNIAFFERYGAAGFAAYEDVCHRARDLGLLVVGDVKRGDIGPTAEAYAEVHLELADAVTLHPLMGKDSVEPFLKKCDQTHGAVFVLVRTSNPSAVEFQSLEVGGRELSDVIAAQVDAWGKGRGSSDAFGPVGAVVGATYPHELARLRKLMPRAPILIPGVGAQGATVADTLAAFAPDGQGGLVNQSRGVVSTFAPSARDWLEQIERAAREFAAQMRGALRSLADLRSQQGDRV